MNVITMKNLLQNPTGSHSSSFARRDLIIANLEDRYLKLINTRKVEINIYKDKGDYFFHLIVPSEKFTDKLEYDVVLQFIPIGGSTGDLTINNYAIKMFSNSPNFMFTYAYVYNKDGVLVDFTKGKLSKQCLTDEPKVKNPHQTYGFEKSVYFSLLYIKEKKLNLKSNLAIATKLDSKKILKSIETSEEKLKEYNRLDKIEKDEIKREKEKEKKKNVEVKKSIVSSRTKVNKTKVNRRVEPKKALGKKTSRFGIKKSISSTLKRK